MDRKGLTIWIIGMLLLGSMAAYLFGQSKRNREELDRQASRNLLMMRDALKNSVSDLRWEIRSFIRYRAVVNIDTVGNPILSRLSKAAENEKRNKKKFTFQVQAKSGPSIVFSDSITMGRFHFKEICDDLIDDKGLDLAKSLEKLKVNGNDNTIPHIDSINFSFRLPYKALVREFVDNNAFFDKLILTDTSGDVRYPEDLKGINFKASLDSMSARFTAGSIEKFEIHLNSTPYIVYLTPLVEDNQQVWVLGLKDREDMDNAAYKIDYTILTVLGLALLLLLILTPALSFVSMDKGDVLTQSKVSKIGFSLLILMIIAGWSCTYFIHLSNPVDKEGEYDYLIRKKLKASLNSMLDYLKNDALYDNTQNKSQAPRSIDAIFTANSIGNLIHHRTAACLYCDTQYYDYSYISVTHRNYFMHFQNKKNLANFFVERIFSQLNGSPLNIMSTWHADKNRVRAISFALDNLPLDSDRSYLLVKESGEVIHTSKKFEIPFTQLHSVLNPDDWEVFRTLVEYGKDKDFEETWDFPLRINGHQYRALISSMKFEKKSGIRGQTFWFIYLIDPNVYHLKSGLSSLEGLILVTLYLIVVSSFLYLPSLFLKKKYNWKKHSFWWLLFREHRSRNFDGVLIALTVLLLVWIPFMLLKTASLAQIMLYNGLAMLVAITFALYFLRYRAKSTHPGKSNRFQLFIVIWFLCLGFFPGYFIGNAVFRMEETIWENTLETNINSAEKQKFPQYQQNRSILFEGTVDSPDHQFEKYVYPSAESMNKALKSINLGVWKELSELPGNIVLLLGIFSVLAFTLLWRGIRLLTRQLFWMDFNVRESNALGSIIQSELGATSGLRLFLCGCDSHASRSWIYSQFQLEKDQLEIVDCANSGLVLPTEKHLANKKVLLIENVHTLDDLKVFMEQIPPLLQLANSINLIFSSGSSWKTLASKMPNDLARVRFSELMSGFYFEFVPLRPSTLSVPLHSGERFDELEVEQFFFKQGMLNKNDEDPNARLLIQRYGKAFYYNIWAELSLEEQNVCYSYAKEGFFSFKNHDEVIELFQKGVVTKNELGGNLQLFSKTFRYFILANISKEQLTEIKNFRKKNSNSANIQWAIFFFLIIAIALIGYFERSFFTEIQALVTGISGFIAFLIGEFKKFFSPKSQ